MRYLSAGERVAEYFQEYLEAVLAAQQFQQSNVRTWTLLQCYAEFQFRLNGGGHCAICNATVRHLIPVTDIIHGKSRSPASSAGAFRLPKD